MPLPPLPTPLRPDLREIAARVGEGARVLDVGCGAGELLAHLVAEKGVDGRGIELDPAQAQRCVARGLAVIQGDADEDLAVYPDGAFDYCILSRSLQVMRHPDRILREMLRIAPRAVLSVPNFGYWRNRWHLLAHGRMPVTRALSYQWYETPNIHFCTLKDFVILCHELGLRITAQVVVTADGRAFPARADGRFANLWAEQGVFEVERANL